MNGKRAEVKNISKHVVIVSSVSVFSFVFLSLLPFYRISLVCLALHACAPRGSLASLARSRASRAPRGNPKSIPRWHPKSTRHGAKTCQDGAKTSQDGAKTGQDGARTCKDGAKTGQDDAEQSKAKQNKAKQSKAKAKQSKAKQSKHSGEPSKFARGTARAQPGEPPGAAAFHRL